MRVTIDDREYVVNWEYKMVPTRYAAQVSSKPHKEEKRLKRLRRHGITTERTLCVIRNARAPIPDGSFEIAAVGEVRRHGPTRPNREEGRKRSLDLAVTILFPQSNQAYFRERFWYTYLHRSHASGRRQRWKGDPKAMFALRYLLSVGFTAADYKEAKAEPKVRTA